MKDPGSTSDACSPCHQLRRACRVAPPPSSSCQTCHPRHSRRTRSPFHQRCADVRDGSAQCACGANPSPPPLFFFVARRPPKSCDPAFRFSHRVPVAFLHPGRRRNLPLSSSAVSVLVRPLSSSTHIFSHSLSLLAQEQGTERSMAAAAATACSGDEPVPAHMHSFVTIVANAQQTRPVHWAAAVWVSRVVRRYGKPLPDVAEHVVHQSVCWAVTDHGVPAAASSEPVAPTHLRCRSAVPFQVKRSNRVRCWKRHRLPNGLCCFQLHRLPNGSLLRANTCVPTCQPSSSAACRTTSCTNAGTSATSTSLEVSATLPSATGSCTSVWP